MGTFSLVSELPLIVEGYRLTTDQLETSSGFVRQTTTFNLSGKGLIGCGEDVTYDSEDHQILAEAPLLPLAGEYTLASFSERLDSLELFTTTPVRPASLKYRRWALESAAFDLALQQNGLTFEQALGRRSSPLNFVVSLRLGEPATIKPLVDRLNLYPDLRFKIDPTSSWDQTLCDQLKELDCLEVLDLKGLYVSSEVDQPADPLLYQLVADNFADLWIEDPLLTAQTQPILEPLQAQITWDANIDGIPAIKALPYPPRCLNFKPSRFGTLKALLDSYDFCEEHGITIYGGGQFELGCGRNQIQRLAAVFHPDTPNDVAPVGYHPAVLPAGLPSSPLTVEQPLGF